MAGVRMPLLISSCSSLSLSLTAAFVLPRTVRRKRLPVPSWPSETVPTKQLLVLSQEIPSSPRPRRFLASGSLTGCLFLFMSCQVFGDCFLDHVGEAAVVAVGH